MELKEFIIELSKEFSILSQFTSFVAIEERVCAFCSLFICNPYRQRLIRPALPCYRVCFIPSCFKPPNQIDLSLFQDSEQTEGFTDIPKLIAEEDVDSLPYISWISDQAQKESINTLLKFGELGEIREEKQVRHTDMLKYRRSISSRRKFVC